MGSRRAGSILSVVAVLASVTPGAAAQTSQGPRVAYVLQGSIYAIDAAGGVPVQLTQGTSDADPAWSPDGSRIAFVGAARTEPDTDLELHVMNADGSGLTQITSTPGNERDPSWSPDGDTILVSRSDPTDSDIYSIRIDGSGEQVLTANGTDDLDPAFSPDGTQIAFASSRDAVTACRRAECVAAPEIYTMDADGSNQTRVTVDIDDDERGCCGSPDYAPTWSPDGTRIAFERRGGPGEGSYIALMNSNGTQQSGLISRREGAAAPSWLAAGNLIAFTQGARQPKVAISTLGGGCVRILTPGSDPSWEPGTQGAPQQFCPAPTIAYDAGAEAFSGIVDPTGAQFERAHSRDKAACATEQTLRLMRGVRGRDIEVASGSTGGDDTWRIPWPVSAEGNYYVRLDPKRTTTDDGGLVFCAGSRSVALPVPPIADGYSGPPPVTFVTRSKRIDVARGTYSWCHSINFFFGSCLIADAFGYPFPNRATPAPAGGTARVTFHRDERPRVGKIRYWRKIGEFNRPEGQARRIDYVLRHRPRAPFGEWDAVFTIPGRHGEVFITFDASWKGSRGTGSGGGNYGLHLEIR